MTDAATQTTLSWEEMALAHLRESGQEPFMVSELHTRFWLHVVNCMKVPRGLADASEAGSQRAYFSFALPSGSWPTFYQLVAGLPCHEDRKFPA